MHYATQTVATASLYTGTLCNLTKARLYTGCSMQPKQLLQPVYTRVHHANQTVATASLYTGALCNLVTTASLYTGALCNPNSCYNQSIHGCTMQTKQLLQPVNTRVHYANQTVATASLYTGALCNLDSCYSQSIHGCTMQLEQLLQPVYTRVHYAT